MFAQSQIWGHWSESFQVRSTEIALVRDNLGKWAKIRKNGRIKILQRYLERPIIFNDYWIWN